MTPIIIVRILSNQSLNGKNPSSILKTLQVCSITFTAIAPDKVAIIEAWLYYCIICTCQGFSRSKGAATFYGMYEYSMLDGCRRAPKGLSRPQLFYYNIVDFESWAKTGLTYPIFVLNQLP